MESSSSWVLLPLSLHDSDNCFLRAAACKDRELAVKDQFSESLIFGPKILFGELFSKIIFKSSSDSLILRDSQKFENAVKVRFFGQLKVQNNVRERSTAKYLK